MLINKTIKWDRYHPEVQKESSEEDNGGGLKTLVQTPFGVFKLNTSLSPFTRFNFWLANTNFSISKKTKAILDCTDGVEALIVISKYQFIIGIGKLFDSEIVKKNIEKKLNTNIKFGFKSYLNNNFKYWAAYRFPNMNIDYIGDSEPNKVQNKLSFYNQIQKISKGKIFKSNSIKLLNETNKQ